MKAAVSRPGGVIEIRDVAMPVPQHGEALVRVLATTVSAADYRLNGLPYFLGRAFGHWHPKRNTIFGMELAGIVESVGEGVTRLRAGDPVFGSTGMLLGAHAQYARAKAGGLETKPANLTFEEAAAVAFGAYTALCFLRRANVGAGQNVLVYGASGSVGVFAVQLAKYFGARVTGVCSTANVDMVRSLGADAVVDYTKEDFSRAGRVYDMVFDTVGKSGFSRSVKALKRGAPYVRISMSGGLGSLPVDALKQLWLSATGAARCIGGVAREAPTDLAFIKSLIEAGKLKTVIDRRYPLDEIAAAFEYAERGHKRGHVVIKVDEAIVAAIDGPDTPRP
jgi:NADPH:quinone reductase-like Zn-dependent oxidoreductase